MEEAAFAGLKRQRPEWAPWLAVIEEVVRDVATPAWDTAVRGVGPDRNGSVPLLNGATVSIEEALVRELFGRLIRRAFRVGPKMAGLQPVLSAEVDVAMMFSASVRQDHQWVGQVAAEFSADPEALQAVAALLAVPFLQACNRQWSALPESWVEGYCPICGAWPAFAEVRGIERTRCLRCGRCGAAWHAHTLHCPFCTTNNHQELAALVPEKPGASAVIEACKRCRGYVKTFTKLQGCPPVAVLLEDLASVDLDVAALDQGYVRPATVGCAIAITVNGKSQEHVFQPESA